MDKNIIELFESSLLKVIAEVIKNKIFDDREILRFDEVATINMWLIFNTPLKKSPVILSKFDSSVIVIKAGQWGELNNSNLAIKLLNNFQIEMLFEEKEVRCSCEKTDTTFAFSQAEMLNVGIDFEEVVKVLRQAFSYYSANPEHCIFPGYPEIIGG